MPFEIDRKGRREAQGTYVSFSRMCFRLTGSQEADQKFLVFVLLCRLKLTARDGGRRKGFVFPTLGCVLD